MNVFRFYTFSVKKEKLNNDHPFFCPFDKHVGFSYMTFFIKATHN